MKKKKEILNIKKLFCILAAVLPMRTYASESDCSFFNPAYALCSVHSYNIGFTNEDESAPANPIDAEQISEMNEVIALKATVIAQQMKQQYDFLNATIKRFKTQLEKAVLTSKMEILTGTSATGSSSGSSYSSSSNNGLSNAEDCAFETYDRVFDCLAKNMRLIQQEVDKNQNAARKQLENDIKVMNNENLCKDEPKKDDNDCNKISACNNNLTTRNDIKTCAAALYRKASKKSDEEETNRRRSLYGN